MLVELITVWLMYALSKRVLSGTTAFVPPLLFIIICGSLPVSHHSWGNLFLLLTILCLTAYPARAQSLSEPGPKVVLCIAGVMAGMTLLSMQSKGFWTVVVGVAFLISAEKRFEGLNTRWAPRRGLGKSLWFLLGSGLVLGIALAYFSAQNAVRDWGFDNVTFLFTNYWSYEVAPHPMALRRLTDTMAFLAKERTLRVLLYSVGYYF